MFALRAQLRLLMAGILLAAPICAHAFNPFESIKDYNAVILGNAYAEGGDTEGRLAVGGDLHAKWYSVGGKAAAGASKYSLVVGGSLNAEGKWQVYNGDTAAKNVVAAPSMVAPYQVLPTNPLDFDQVRSQMKSMSTYLAALTGTAIAEWDGRNTVRLTGTNTQLNVFNLTKEQAEKWSVVTSREIRVPAGSTVVINIPGEDCKIANGMTLYGTSNSKVIFNYYQAKNLEIRSMALEGSLLAPDASLSLISGSVNGIGVVNNSTQLSGGEYHQYGFNGSVPEPSTLALCLAGLAMMPLMRRKRA